MSKRQSRVSVDTRQNDALLEFENFKKKFLLANKHITKLNSTLSVRIEELNAQITILHAENLRLRASEIALANRLKKEQDKTRRIMADAEAATHTLMKHLTNIRKSFSIPPGRPDFHVMPLPPQPRARRPTLNPDSSPIMPRIARPPTIPGIAEDEEPEYISPHRHRPDPEEDEVMNPTPPRRKSRPRTSTTNQFVPARSASPPPVDSLPILDFEETLGKNGKRKPTRRQSGLLTTSMSITTVTAKGVTTEIIPPRSPSPAFGSPLRRDAAAREGDEMLAAMGVVVEEEDDEPLAVTVTKRDKKKTRNQESRGLIGGGGKRDREKRLSGESEDSSSTSEMKKLRLKDVTNSPPPRPTLLNLDTAIDRQRTPDTDTQSATSTSSWTTARGFMTPSIPTKPLLDLHLPTPRTSSPLPPEFAPESDMTALGRERRVRKSINYAEPKLNTKMRKPDPPLTSTNKRSSTTSSSSLPRNSLEAPPLTSANLNYPMTDSTTPHPPPVAGVKRKKSRPYVLVEDGEESEGVQADAEYGGERWENIDGRRRSTHISVTSSRRLVSEDLRRHSVAV